MDPNSTEALEYRAARTPAAGAGRAICVGQPLTLLIARERAWTATGPWASGSCAPLAGHLVLNRRLPRRDPLLFPLAMLLTGWGLNLIARLVPSVCRAADALAGDRAGGAAGVIGAARRSALAAALSLYVADRRAGAAGDHDPGRTKPGGGRAAPVDLVGVGAHLLSAVRTAQNAAGRVPGKLLCRSPAFYARGYDPHRVGGSAVPGVSGAACC